MFLHHCTSSVYPRWRGEHAGCDFAIARLAGLSPLARGTHPNGEDVNKGWRFIPAGAGNTNFRLTK
ncbi:hypothetical protein ECoL_00063 [Escherichia coli EC4100B]|nr:hypothetical protein ECoL_00063 [Escherichia coli EC4100B]